MADYFNSRLGYLACKEETTAGTAITVADEDFDVRVYEPKVTLGMPFDNEGSKHATGDHAEDEAISGPRPAKIEFSTKYCWGGAVDTAPNQAKLLKSCGLVETAYASAGIGWAPYRSADETTMTFKLALTQVGASPAGLVFTISGAVGSCVMGCESIGGPLMCRWSYDGTLDSVTDIANGSHLELTGADTALAEKLAGVTFTIGGTEVLISKFSLDFGNDIQPIYDQSEDTGILYHHIAGKAPRFSCDPLVVPTTTFDIYDNATDEVIEAISLAFPSTHLTLSIARAQVMTPSLASREGKDAWELNYRCLRQPSGGSAEIQARTFMLLQGATS